MHRQGPCAWTLVALLAACTPVRAPATDPASAADASRRLAAARDFPAALREVGRCLRAPDADRSRARLACLYLGQHLVDVAYAVYCTRLRWLDDLRMFAGYPGGRDAHGNDKRFIRDRARGQAALIEDGRTFATLEALRGPALKARCDRELERTRRELAAMGLFQARDPDAGPIRTYRFARKLDALFPASPHAAEVAFWLLTERRELRRLTENRPHPALALAWRNDLEQYLARHPTGRFADRAAWHLGILVHDEWLLVRPDLQSTDDYRSYLALGGTPVDARRAAALRQRALDLLGPRLARWLDLTPSYRPLEEPRWDLERGKRCLENLRQATPPADAFPAALFPPG